MSEEEIIEIIEELMCLYKEQMNCNKYYNEIIERSTRNFNGLQGLLNLYNKERAENKELKEKLRNHNIDIVREQIENLYIPKSKIEEKIEEVFDILDTKPYTAYTLYGDELFDSSDIKEVLHELLEENNNDR